MAGNRTWADQENVRGHKYKCCEGQHVSLADLKKDHNDSRLKNNYLGKIMPFYPESVVFNVSSVCHVTEEESFRSIIKHKGFRKHNNGSDDKFLWWSLSVTTKEIDKAEESLYTNIPADRKPPFLRKFTDSPAFLEKSRYGNFKFTFPLSDLLNLYMVKCCGNYPPVLRVMDTRIYKKEIMYSVVVHPDHVKLYDKYPCLPHKEGSVCWYKQGIMSWCCQSPSDAYKYELIVDEVEGIKIANVVDKFYVWDHIALAFHMEEDWMLGVEHQKLFNSASVCDVDEPNLLKRKPGLSLEEAKAVLEEVILNTNIN